jgi:Tol biopolymer transport system component
VRRIARGRQKLVLVGLAGALAASIVGCNAQASFEQGLSLPETGGGLAAWSPDGKRIAVPTKNGIDLLSTTGGVARHLSTPPSIDRIGRSSGSRLSWSDQGRRLHFLSRASPSPQNGVAACTVGVSGGRQHCVPLDVPVFGATWAPGGWPLVFIPNATAYTPKGRVGPKPDLWRLDNAQATPRRILAGRGEELDPIFSPDGHRILFTRFLKGRAGLWIVDANGADPHLLADGLDVLGTSWSPNGQQVAIAAATHKGGDRIRLYVVPADGGRLCQASREEILPGPPAWTPDGRWITYSNYSGEIREVHPDGRGARTIATLPGEEVRNLLWSPAGAHLAYTARPFPPID